LAIIPDGRIIGSTPTPLHPATPTIATPFICRAIFYSGVVLWQVGGRCGPLCQPGSRVATIMGSVQSLVARKTGQHKGNSSMAWLETSEHGRTVVVAMIRWQLERWGDSSLLGAVERWSGVDSLREAVWRQWGSAVSLGSWVLPIWIRQGNSGAVVVWHRFAWVEKVRQQWGVTGRRRDETMG
jgi:hypothetical protein